MTAARLLDGTSAPEEVRREDRYVVALGSLEAHKGRVVDSSHS